MTGLRSQLDLVDLVGMKKAKSRGYGMTLVELIVVVAIVAILSMIAVPNFFEYQKRARRMDAKIALDQIATNQEQSYITNHSYTTNLAQLGFSSNLSESGYYVISVPVANIQGFKAIAVPAPGSRQANDTDCQQFTIDNQNTRAAAPDPGGKCWD